MVDYDHAGSALVAILQLFFNENSYMYVPSHFAEPRIEVMQSLIRAHSLATLVVHSQEGLEANHIPLILRDDGSTYGTLVGHVARGNSLWKLANPTIDVLAIFHGAESYISPNWYATKQETGKVVPTWNYAVVHAHGAMKVIDDKAWLLELITNLTDRHEAASALPWKVSDAPADYTDKLLSAIVGIEIPITRLVGKWKVSQNQPAANKQGVVDGLRSMKTEGTDAMAALVQKQQK
jgi:transcriptional regulator